MDSACAPRAQRSANGSWSAAMRAACSLTHFPGCRSTPRAMHALSAETALISRVGFVEERLLVWFAEHARDLPWRRTRDPYAILVSEVMLQQTQVERVVPRYLRWLERWPTAQALADASMADVIREWQGGRLHTPPPPPHRSVASPASKDRSVNAGRRSCASSPRRHGPSASSTRKPSRRLRATASSWSA